MSVNRQCSRMGIVVILGRGSKVLLVRGELKVIGSDGRRHDVRRRRISTVGDAFLVVVHGR